MYDSVDEANQKLRHTVCMYGKAPVYITQAGGTNSKITLALQYLRSGALDEKNLTDKSWEFRDLGSRVGYVNIVMGKGSYNEALYLTRMPIRQSHNTQGLSQKNLYIPGMKGSPNLGLPQQTVTFAQLYVTKPFHNMMEDAYPDLEDLSDLFSKESWLTSKAFHRQFAVRRGDVGPFYLQYRGRDIGHSDDLQRWKVAQQFKYLDETFSHLKLKVS